MDDDDSVATSDNETYSEDDDLDDCSAQPTIDLLHGEIFFAHKQYLLG